MEAVWVAAAPPRHPRDGGFVTWLCGCDVVLPALAQLKNAALGLGLFTAVFPIFPKHLIVYALCFERMI